MMSDNENLNEKNEDGPDKLSTITTSTAVYLGSKTDAAYEELSDEIPMTFPQKVIIFICDNEASSCVLSHVIGSKVSIHQGRIKWRGST